MADMSSLASLIEPHGASGTLGLTLGLTLSLGHSHMISQRSELVWPGKANGGISTGFGLCGMNLGRRAQAPSLPKLPTQCQIPSIGFLRAQLCFYTSRL